MKFENCETSPKTIKHKYNRDDAWERTITLPVLGRFVEESHYATNADSFTKNNWPSHSSENIESHLRASFNLFRQYDTTMTYEQLYSQSWHKEWTPEEGGHFGQGSIGESQLNLLTSEDELWLLTMMWASGEKPKPGTKFLLSANNKSVVVIAGFETGSSSKTYIGGVTREVHAWLGTNSSSEIKIGYLSDQKINSGPINCNN